MEPLLHGELLRVDLRSLVLAGWCHGIIVADIERCATDATGLQNQPLLGRGGNIPMAHR